MVIGTRTAADGESAVAEIKSKGGEAKPKKEMPAPVVPGNARRIAEKDKSTMSFKEREAQWAKDHPGELNYM